MTNTDSVIHGMECGVDRIINLLRLTQERLLEARRDKKPKMEDSISGSAGQTQTLWHFTVNALSNTRTEILEFFGS